VLQRLTKRRDFVAAARALSQAMPGVVVQVRKRDDDAPARVGFTCTKKLGNAVVRNRIKRRMKEAARLSLSASARFGYDYVLIGRAASEKRPFEALRKDLISALIKLHAADHASTITEINATQVQGGSGPT
jgi:ribonuclease P protein component